MCICSIQTHVTIKNNVCLENRVTDTLFPTFQIYRSRGKCLIRKHEIPPSPMIVIPGGKTKQRSVGIWNPQTSSTVTSATSQSGNNLAHLSQQMVYITCAMLHDFMAWNELEMLRSICCFYFFYHLSKFYGVLEIYTSNLYHNFIKHQCYRHLWKEMRRAVII